MDPCGNSNDKLCYICGTCCRHIHPVPYRFCSPSKVCIYPTTDNDYGFITDYLAGFIRELRKDQYGDAIDKYFRLGKNLNQRDTIAVRRMVDGYLKLLYPDSGDSEVWDGMDEGTLSKTKEMLDDMHKRKIDLADGIYVINVGGYIGDSTRSEIAYAKAHGKKVEYLEK